jgi:hypothetical protein
VGDQIEHDTRGYIIRFGEVRNAYRIFTGKLEGKWSLEKPKNRWQDNIKADLRGISCELNQCRVQVIGYYKYGTDHSYSTRKKRTRKNVLLAELRQAPEETHRCAEILMWDSCKGSMQQNHSWDVMVWTGSISGMDQWRALVNTVMNLRVPWKCWEVPE